MKKSDKKSSDKEDKAIDIKLISDHGTLKQIILLLSYIKDAIRENKSFTINVNVATERKANLSLTVNDQQLPEYKAKQSITIN